MGLIFGSASFTRYVTEGQPPNDFMETLSENVARHTFRKLNEDSTDEHSAGWVNVMDMFDTRLHGLPFLKEPYISLSLRIDERKIPSTALKQYALEAEERIKEEEHLDFLPKNRREDIKEGVRSRLLKRAIPVARAYDMIWNYITGIVTFGCTNNRICDAFVELFLKTFHLQLRAVCPYTLGVMYLEQEGVSPELLDNLQPARFLEEA